MKLFIPFAITGAVLLLASCHRSPQSVPEKMNPAVILTVNEGEQLDPDQIEERVRLCKLLKPVVRGDTLALDQSAEALATAGVAPVYSQYMNEVLLLLNRYIPLIPTELREIVSEMANQDAERNVLTGLCRENKENGLYEPGISREEALQAGISAAAYDTYVQELQRHNETAAAPNGIENETTSVQSPVMLPLSVFVVALPPELSDRLIGEFDRLNLNYLQ
mgnify:FL=1